MKQMKLTICIFLIALMAPALAACAGQTEPSAAEVDLAAQTQTVPMEGGGDVG